MDRQFRDVHALTQVKTMLGAAPNIRNVGVARGGAYADRANGRFDSWRQEHAKCASGVSRRPARSWPMAANSHI